MPRGKIQENVLLGEEKVGWKSRVSVWAKH